MDIERGTTLRIFAPRTDERQVPTETQTRTPPVVKLAAGSATQSVLPFTGLNDPWGVAVDSAGNLYVTDGQNNRVVKLPGGVMRRTAGTRGYRASPTEATAVILTASARLLAHPRQLAVDETVGPDSASFRGGFNGWSVLETLVLNRYRVTAQ